MTNKCVVCGHDGLVKLNLISRDKDHLDLLKCTNCYHLFQDPNSYKDIYTSGEFTQIARDNQKTPSKEKIYKLDKKALERVRYYDTFLSNKFDNVLEIGSSIGSFVHHLKLTGKNAIGLEPDPFYAEFSKDQYGFEQICDTIENLKDDKKFDAICSFHVLEHIENLDNFFEKIISILNDDGKLLFEMPSLDLHNYGILRKTIWKPHVHYFTLSSLYYIVSKYLNVIDIGFYGESLYVYAVRANKQNFDNLRFRKLKSKHKRIYNFLRILPSIQYKEVNINQLALQPFYQKNVKDWIRKFYLLTGYGLKEKIYVYNERSVLAKKKITHITYYRGWENTGDTVLSKCVRDSFNKQYHNIKWDLDKITNPVNHELIRRINKSKCMVLGGGGVLIPDTNKNSISGWQWAISNEQLDRISVPIILFAIGYNYFPKQKPEQFFIDNLQYIIEKSSFIGLRNRGSIQKVSELIGGDLSEKLRFQPCPTTIIRKLYKNLPGKISSKNIAVNIAYDRYEKRFGSNIYVILDQIALALKELEKQGYNIFNVCHLNDDSRFELSLNKVGVNYKTVYLNFKLPIEVYKFYNEMELVMGMRGHAQMIPFGLNCKIISLGSHDKMRWFLEDIDAKEWYVNLHEDVNNIGSRILEIALYQLSNDKLIFDKLCGKQDYLYNITIKNFKEIRNIIPGL